VDVVEVDEDAGLEARKDFEKLKGDIRACLEDVR
jgi:hypothetical protein